MDITSAIKAKIATGVLHSVNGVVVHQARSTPGVCVACDTTVAATDIGVQFDTASGRCLLHVDCYVMWSKACAD